jgi:hypothetical protein
VQSPEHGSHARQVHGALEAMQLEARATGLLDQVGSISGIRRLGQHPSRIGFGQFLVQPFHHMLTSLPPQEDVVAVVAVQPVL